MLSRKHVNTFDDSEHVRKKRKRDSQDALTFKSENSDETESQLHLYLGVSDEETDLCSNIGLSDLKYCREASNHVRNKTNLISESVSNVTSDVLYVFVDTETTGINHEKDEILQIAATSNKSLKPCFNQYILPSCPMGKDVTQLNGLCMHKGNLQWNRKAVCADHCGAILENFLAYLDELKQLFRIESLVIVAHLASFDMKFLCVQFFKYDLWERFKEMVCGIVDTLDIFRKVLSLLILQKFTQMKILQEPLIMLITMHGCYRIYQVWCINIFQSSPLLSLTMKENISPVLFKMYMIINL